MALRNVTTEQLEAELDRRKNQPPRPKLVEYTLFLHGSKESARAAAEEAGFSDEEIEKYGLSYAGYEHKIKVTVNTVSGKVTEQSEKEVLVHS